MHIKGKIRQTIATYDGISGAGSAWPLGRPCGRGGAPPGRFGMAGAGLPAGG